MTIHPSVLCYRSEALVASHLDPESYGRSLAGYLPHHDPLHLLQCVEEVRTGGITSTQTVSQNPVRHGFFRTIDRGFFLGDQAGRTVYRFPQRREPEVEHARWWWSASESLASIADAPLSVAVV